MIDLKNATSQEIAVYFSHEVNNMFFKPDLDYDETKCHALSSNQEE